MSNVCQAIPALRMHRWVEQMQITASVAHHVTVDSSLWAILYMAFRLEKLGRTKKHFHFLHTFTSTFLHVLPVREISNRYFYNVMCYKSISQLEFKNKKSSNRFVLWSAKNQKICFIKVKNIFCLPPNPLSFSLSLSKFCNIIF